MRQVCCFGARALPGCACDRHDTSQGGRVKRGRSRCYLLHVTVWERALIALRSLLVVVLGVHELLHVCVAHGDTAPQQPDVIPQSTVVLAVDDTRSHGPSARNWFDAAVDIQEIVGRNDEGVQALTEQLSGGLPTPSDRDLRNIVAPLLPYQLRFRTLSVHTSRGWTQGPLTVGVQRYFPIEHVSIFPLAEAHLGLETVFSTPWLSDRHAIPPRAVQVVDGVDTELAGNGWSWRPLSAYVRADYLACRSLFVEAGAAPEVFAPTNGSNEYDLRFHVAVGWSLACGHRAGGGPKFSLEYKGRARMYEADAMPAYWQSIGIGVQYDVGGLVAQLLASAAPGDLARGYWMIGLRLQLGARNYRQ